MSILNLNMTKDVKRAISINKIFILLKKQDKL